MCRKVVLLLYVFLSVAFINVNAQDSTFLTKAVSGISTQPAQEKVYLHLDKPNYGFGDTIWYKAYTVIGQKHQLSALSGVLYVELISPKDSLVTRQTLPLVSGISWSDIPLPHTLKPGTYRVRAYTRWMQNMGPDYFYDQKIAIGGAEPVTVKPSPAAHPDVQFFPEGGELVNGVRSRVAIKAVGLNGLGENIKGTIADNNGTIVAEFTTQHLGMGAFALTPEAGKGYTAKISLPGENTFTVDLPQAKETGYTLAINNTDKDSIYVKIVTNEQTLNADKDKTFYIIAQSSGKVYYATEGILESTAYMARVEKSRFPEGIAQFTLFSQSGEPLAERIAFVENKNNELNLNISSSNPTYTTRDKVKLELTAKDSSQKPVIGTFSVSIINESKVQPDENNESTILNNLLLTSELKGYIEQPNYYFTNTSDKTRADLDLLLLTQGYRKYEWKQVLNNDQTVSTVVQFRPERSLELSGTLKTTGGQPIPNGKVTLASTKQNLFRDTTADANGKFTFTNLYLTDTAILVLRARKANNGSNVKITAFSPDYPKIYPMLNNESVALSPDTNQQTLSKKQYSNYQKEQNNDSLRNGKTLKTVTITGLKRPKTPELPNSSNLHGGGNADQVIMYDQMGDGADLSSRLIGKVNFVNFDKNGAPINLRSMGKMAIVVDGITMTGDHLDDLNADDVYSIEVIRTSFAKNIYGSSLPGDGALIITTRRGADAEKTDTTQKFTAKQQYDQYEKAQQDELLKNGKTLNTVKITGIKKPKEPVILNSANLNGPGHADQVVMYNKISDCIILSDCLNGILLGVTFSKPDLEGKRKAYLMRDQNKLNGQVPMTVIVDGMVMDGSHLDDLSGNDIYSIEVLRSGAYLAIYGSNAPGGALVITTKRGGEGTAYFTQAAPNGIMTFPFTGYYRSKTFYVPKYETSNTAPDNRTTVYWNPNILTDKDGKTTLEYFNNDTKGTYRVVVEGIDDEGNIGRAVYRYQVE